MERKYTLVVKNKRIEVSKEVYKTYYKCREKERYARKLANDAERSLDKLIEDGASAEYQLVCTQPSPEDRFMRKELVAKLYQCLELLDGNERDLINELFFIGKSGRELSAQTGVPRTTIQSRKNKILLKMKKSIEN